MIKSFIPASGFWAIAKSSRDQSMWAFPLLGFALVVKSCDDDTDKYEDIVPVSCEMASGRPTSSYGCLIIPEDSREVVMVVHETQCGNIERKLIEEAKFTDMEYPFLHEYEPIKRKKQ